MVEQISMNNITGTWASVEAGGLVVVEGTYFSGTVADTGQRFEAFYAGYTFGPSLMPGSVSGGTFSFNGPLDKFFGWSGGYFFSAGYSAANSYSLPRGDYRLEMRGVATDLELGFALGYTSQIDWLNGDSSRVETWSRNADGTITHQVHTVIGTAWVDGERVDLLHTSTIVRDASGKIISRTQVTNEVTNGKAATNIIREAHSHAENKGVVERCFSGETLVALPKGETKCICDGMQLGVHAALCATDQTAPLFAVRCAFR